MCSLLYAFVDQTAHNCYRQIQLYLGQEFVQVVAEILAN